MEILPLSLLDNTSHLNTKLSKHENGNTFVCSSENTRINTALRKKFQKVSYIFWQILIFQYARLTFGQFRRKSRKKNALFQQTKQDNVIPIPDKKEKTRLHFILKISCWKCRMCGHIIRRMKNNLKSKHYVLAPIDYQYILHR